MANQFDMKCPACGNDDLIEVRAECWRLLCVNGTDDGPSMDGYNWVDASECHCAKCGHLATAKDFEF
jgi:hypothetical protein